ncbi:lysophospholipid acyltransferase family protein [Leptolyngbya sp. BL0902]|uniref:lysophospholipid acyltransferase family protein n=1 Tax=Leptolyngbya sp. BL0902 TaxID=1115757 RepID=UPI001CEDC10C|nr:1-acyl-sn-glycerol-3-phosphate acyltransferase [Leptolyngbya sp. BL0902]
MPESKKVQPRMGFIPPHYREWVVRGGYFCLPFLLRVRLRPWLPVGIWPVTCPNPEVLAELFHQFQQGKIRLLMAFRHSQVDDPLSLSYLFSRLVPRAAQAKGIALRRPIHSFFMYDRGMPLWAGKWLEWFFASMGGIPVHRGRRLDLKALKSVREHLVNGPFPVTIAPEGATNGHGEVISPLEPGTAQVAFWAVEDLHKAQRPEAVILLPVGLQYVYPKPDWAALNRLLSQLEADCGIAVQSLPTTATAVDYYPRLIALGHHLLGQMEQFYARFYGGPWPEMEQSSKNSETGLSPESNPASSQPSGTEQPIESAPSLATPSAQALSGNDIARRLKPLLNRALEVGEQFFGLPHSGTLETRCRRLEEAGWMYIYREDIDHPDRLSPFDRGLANWMAEAARLHLRHMRLVESFVAVSGDHAGENPSFERLAETSLILFDLVERVKGTAVPKRPQLGRRQAIITLGQPMNISERWDAYAGSRRAAKAAVENLTADLQQVLTDLIQPT